MGDTTREFEALLTEGYARMTPEERVRVCTEMFDTAVALAESSLPDGLDPAARRLLICRRFYGELADRAFGAEAPPGTHIP
jgi:hypothetical protein